MQDYLTHSGAQSLAAQIRSYWAERGIVVETTVDTMRGGPGSGGAQNVTLWVVRSTLTGTERDELPAKAA